MVRCERCQGCLYTEHCPWGEEWYVYCLNCSARYYKEGPPESSTYTNYGHCACGRESLRGSGDCARCRGAKVSAGMQKKMYLKVMV